MFALLALLTFTLALFDVHIGSVNLLYLGLAFLSAHALFNFGIPWVRRGNP